MSTLPDPITLRRDYADDQLAVRRLAALDSAPVPPSPLLVAEIDGEIRAAVSLHDGAEIAHPFYPTLHLLELLRAHAAGNASPRESRATSWGDRIRGRLVPTPAGFA